VAWRGGVVVITSAPRTEDHWLESRLGVRFSSVYIHCSAVVKAGVDVMITIFGDFPQFSAKKLAFFLNTNVMINFFQNLALF
jgi:hypothetical protein